MQGVVLAAGSGKRLSGLDPQRSKAMMPALGMPLIGRVIQSLLAPLVQDLIVVVSPGDNDLTSYLRTSGIWPQPIQIVEQATPLGMANALQHARPYLRGPFFLSACDSLIEGADWRALHAASRTAAERTGATAMEMAPAVLARDRAVLTLDHDRIRRIVEKPADPGAEQVWTSLPHYLLPERVLAFVDSVRQSARGELELQDALQSWVEAGGIMMGVAVEKRLQLTRPQDLLPIHIALARKHSEDQIVGADKIRPAIYIEEGAEIGQRVVLDSNVFVEAGARIGDGARVSGAVILRGALVGAGSRISGAVLGPGGVFEVRARKN